MHLTGRYCIAFEVMLLFLVYMYFNISNNTVNFGRPRFMFRGFLCDATCFESYCEDIQLKKMITINTCFSCVKKITFKVLSRKCRYIQQWTVIIITHETYMLPPTTGVSIILRRVVCKNIEEQLQTEVDSRAANFSRAKLRRLSSRPICTQCQLNLHHVCMTVLNFKHYSR